ncbi:hypothetical protein ACH4Y0_03165 [Streptomyces sp. NPDC020707]|uniref:hypothetical protein n=1 Tax=Streptomyces sp. NPDC020707 TaxID=3365084 RepID=UPI0037A6DC09
MQYVMHQDAGGEFNELGKRLWDIAEETAPLVEAVTQLRLPEPAVIHLMTLDTWKKAHEESSLRRLHAEAAELDVTTTAKLKAKLKRSAHLGTRFAFWPMMLGEAVELTPGKPELVIVPDALRHAGVVHDDRVLHKILAHEMTHLAQYAADSGAIWADEETYFPEQRGVADRAHMFLIEGHAYWADREITTKIFGEPVTTEEISPDATGQYRKLAERSMPKKAKASQARSLEAVTHLITTQGLDAFNRIWRDRTLIPTRAEAAEPALWIERMAAVQ